MAGNNPITFVVVIPVVVIFWILRTYYMKTSREVKRIEGISKYAEVYVLSFHWSDVINAILVTLNKIENVSDHDIGAEDNID